MEKYTGNYTEKPHTYENVLHKVYTFLTYNKSPYLSVRQHVLPKSNWQLSIKFGTYIYMQ